MANPISKEARLGTYLLNDSSNPLDAETMGAAMRHRIKLVELWGITPGMRILELGCGQGDCTVVLADAVGPEGHVTAIDPAADTYGTPNIVDARRFVKASEVGDRITFHAGQPLPFLASSQEVHYDAVVLAHCIWYFEHPGILASILAAVRPISSRLLVAEYSLHSSDGRGWGHVLASLALNSIEVFRGPESTRNIRALMSPRRIKDMASSAGWKLQEGPHAEELIETEGQSGSWEAEMALFPSYEKDFVARCGEERFRFAVLAQIDAVREAVAAVGGVGNVATMDTWVASFQ